MKRLQELLARLEHLGDLSDDEIAQLETDLLAIFDEVRAGDVDDVAADDVEQLRKIGDGVSTVQGEAEKRIETATERQTEIDKIEAQIRPEPAKVEDPEPDPEPEKAEDPEPAKAEDPDPDPEPAKVKDPEPEPAKADDKEPEPVAASAPALGEIKARQPVQTAPRVEQALPRMTLTPDGRELSRLSDAIGEIIRRREAFGTTAKGFSERVSVVRVDAGYPDDLYLRTDENQRNAEKVDAVVGNATNPALWQSEALVASGGWCAPLPPRYDLMSISEAIRPVRDGLPRFGADRGGVRFIPPPTFAQVLQNQAGGAIDIWTAATDETPGEETKTCQTVTCGTITEVELQAIVRCLQFGNFTQRAYPEWVSVWLTNTLAAHAQVAEIELLDCMCDASTAVTTAAVTGAARDLLHFIGQAAAAYRSRHRMRPDARLRLVLPAWVLDMFAADIVFQQASGELDALGVTGQLVRQWLAARNVNVSFYIDTTTGGGAIWGAQGATDLLNWPETVVWLLFAEGSFLFLDGGTLDLGIVRDSTLNDTNDYQLFAETFEACAFVGVESLCVTSMVCPNGESQVATDETGSLCVAS